MSDLPIVPSPKLTPRPSSRSLASRALWAKALAHELRNPLNAMAMNLSLVQDTLKREGRDDLLSLIKSTREQIDSMNSTLEDFLTFARPPKPVLRPADLNKLTKDLLEFLQADYNRAGIKFTLHMAENLPMVEMDVFQIRSVILNIMGNARKAMNQGGMITIKSGVRGNMICLTIENDGTPIPTDLLHQLFRPFVSGSGGTGLGLAIARKVIREHRGNITAHNRQDGGPVFTVCLPAIK